MICEQCGKPAKQLNGNKELKKWICTLCERKYLKQVLTKTIVYARRNSRTV